MMAPFRLPLLVFLTLLLLHLAEASENTSDTSQAAAEDIHAASYQVYPVLRMKLTSSVLPGAIQMLTAYIELLEQIQKRQDLIAAQETPTTTATSPIVEDLDKYTNNGTVIPHINSSISSYTSEMSSPTSTTSSSIPSSSSILSSSTIPSSSTILSSSTSQSLETADTPAVAVNPEGGLTGTPISYPGKPTAIVSSTPPNTSTATGVSTTDVEHPAVYASTSNRTTVTESGQPENNYSETLTAGTSESSQSVYNNNPETSTVATSTVSNAGGLPVITDPISTTVAEEEQTVAGGYAVTSPSVSSSTVEVTLTTLPDERIDVITQTTPNTTSETATGTLAETTTGFSAETITGSSAATDGLTQNLVESPIPYNATSEIVSAELPSIGPTVATLQQYEQQNGNSSTNSTIDEEEEIYIPDELFALTTSESETTDIPTEAYNITTTESVAGTNVYELNINEETIVDIELILGDKADETKTHKNGNASTPEDSEVSGVERTERRLREEDMRKKIKNSHVERNVEKHRTSSIANSRPIRNNSNINKFNPKLGIPNQPLLINNSQMNKTSNAVKTTLQNIINQQRNKTNALPPLKPNKVSQNILPDANKYKNNTVVKNRNTTTSSATKLKPQSDTPKPEVLSISPNLILNHLKESHFNKTDDEIFLNTLNDIAQDQKKLEDNFGGDGHIDDKTKNGGGDDLVSKFWNLASFFVAIQNFLTGNQHQLLQQAQSAIAEKKEENYLKNVTRQMMFLKIFYNIEAKNARLWRYHGYSKSATKFLKTTSAMPSSEQLKETMTRLMDRGNIKHERTIEATRKFIEELETPDSRVNRALQLCPTLKFT